MIENWPTVNKLTKPDLQKNILKPKGTSSVGKPETYLKKYDYKSYMQCFYALVDAKKERFSINLVYWNQVNTFQYSHIIQAMSNNRQGIKTKNDYLDLRTFKMFTYVLLCVNNCYNREHVS